MIEKIFVETLSEKSYGHLMLQFYIEKYSFIQYINN